MSQPKGAGSPRVWPVGPVTWIPWGSDRSGPVPSEYSSSVRRYLGSLGKLVISLSGGGRAPLEGQVTGRASESLARRGRAAQRNLNTVRLCGVDSIQANSAQLGSRAWDPNLACSAAGDGGGAVT